MDNDEMRQGKQQFGDQGINPAGLIGGGPARARGRPECVSSVGRLSGLPGCEALLEHATGY